MTAICLSLAPNLRCQTLTHLESSLVLIPPALEILFCVSLCIIKRGTDRKHLLLAGDGFLYFLLALLDMLAHVLTVVDNSFSAFKALDLIIGAFSAGPLLMSTLYLALLTQDFLLVAFPSIMRRITKYTHFACVLLAVVFNALGSFLSLRYSRFVNTPSGIVASIGVKYSNEDVVTFMNSFTLVILIFVHGIAFLSCMARIAKIVFEKRRIEATMNGDNEVALFNGLGWMATGIKLGFVEAIIGFVAGSFSMILFRRSLRFLSRACLIIGAVKGMGVVEDFTMFTQRRQSRLDARRSRATILSTLFSPDRRKSFQPMSVMYDKDYKFDSPVSAHTVESFTIQHVITPSPLIFPTSPSPPTALPFQPPQTLPQPQTARVRDSDERRISMYGKQVVVRYRHGRAPTLDLRRFSQLTVPLPTPESLTAVEESPTHPSKALDLSTTNIDPIPNPYSPTDTEIHTKPSRALSLPPSQNKRTPQQGLATLSMPPVKPSRNFDPSSAQNDTTPSATTESNSPFSTKTLGTHGSDSLEVVRALAVQFPGVPAWRLAALQRHMSTAVADDSFFELSDGDITRSNSERSTTSRSGLVRRSSSVKRKPVPRLEDLEAAEEGMQMRMKTRPKTYTPGTENDDPAKHEQRQRPVTHVPAAVRSGTRRSRSTGRSRSSSRGRFSNLGVDYPQAGIPVLADILAQDQAELDAAWKQLGEKKRRPRAASIKSIGSVAIKRTPTPSISASSQRSSLVPEWHNMPEKHESVVVSGSQRGRVSRFSVDSMNGV
ncbi:hypothetical protein BC835DRAFT_1303289 [Cytidiella melzeri]|nr:hypothetical protein BC835DRAFT_1303289 [Cytidiella melzeri]